MLSAFLTSTAIVALAEISDKTMLLAIVLAARLRAPVPILFGILVATLANRALAALIGREAAALLDSPWFRLAIALGFIAMAAWTLVPAVSGARVVAARRMGRVAAIAACQSKSETPQRVHGSLFVRR